MGYRLNRLDEPIFIAVPKPMLTEFGIHHRLESCEPFNCIGTDTIYAMCQNACVAYNKALA